MKSRNTILFGALIIVLISAFTFFLAWHVEKQPKETITNSEIGNVTNKEQQEILQGLSAPSRSTSSVSEKEKQDILNSLTAPSNEF